VDSQKPENEVAWHLPITVKQNRKTNNVYILLVWLVSCFLVNSHTYIYIWYIIFHINPRLRLVFLFSCDELYIDPQLIISEANTPSVLTKNWHFYQLGLHTILISFIITKYTQFPMQFTISKEITHIRTCLCRQHFALFMSSCLPPCIKSRQWLVPSCWIMYPIMIELAIKGFTEEKDGCMDGWMRWITKEPLSPRSRQHHITLTAIAIIPSSYISLLIRRQRCYVKVSLPSNVTSQL
jgi:hypothetical protein